MRSRRRPGRPPLDPHDRSVAVSTRLRTKDMDALCRRAARARRSVAAQMRVDLRAAFRTEN
jgi:hypothetical protein